MTPGAPPDDDPGMMERLDAGEPPASGEEAQARAPYERLLERIRDLDDPAPEGDWEARAVARWSAARRKRRAGVLVGAAAVAAALAAALLLPLCSRPSAPALEIAVIDGSGTTRRGDLAVGDILLARARSDRPYVELRLYLGTKLLASCPGNPSCQRDASVLRIAWKLVERGNYDAVVLSSATPIPAGDGTLERDLLDARGAGVSIERQQRTVSP